MAAENYGRLDVSNYNFIDINTFLNDVKNTVDSVNSLPRDIEKPQVRRREFRGEMMRVAVHGDIGERELTRLAEDLRDEVAALPYVSIVELFGTRREEVTIELSEASMRRFGVDFSEVANAIKVDADERIDFKNSIVQIIG